MENQTPLKLAESYTEIIAWCFFNHIISPYSRFIRIEKDKKIDLSEGQSHKIISTFYQIFPTGLPHANQDSFKFKSKQEHNIFFLNVGIDPFKKWNKIEYKQF